MASRADKGVAEVRELVEALGLRELGYRIAYRAEHGQNVTVVIGHQLLLETEWNVTRDPSSAGWAESLRETILSWPDIALVRDAAIRSEVVPILSALRHGATMGRLGRTDEGVDGALNAISSAALALPAASVLTQQEVDWLLRALDADQEWLSSGSKLRTPRRGADLD